MTGLKIMAGQQTNFYMSNIFQNSLIKIKLIEKERRLESTLRCAKYH